MTKTTVTDPTEDAPAVSTRRKVTASVTTTVVTIGLGLVAQAVIARLADKVHDAIVPDKTESE